MRIKNTCKVENCKRPCHGHNLCRLHYDRWRRYGRLELLKDRCKYPKYPLPNRPERELIIWAAGFFDGEGCIMISYNNYNRKQKTHNLKISVTQVNPEPLKILRGLFCGSITLRKEKLKYPNWKPRYVWTNTCRKAYEAILKLQPFLILKKKQVELAIEFHKDIHYIGHPISDSERQRREKIKNSISQLNQENNIFSF